MRCVLRSQKAEFTLLFQLLLEINIAIYEEHQRRWVKTNNQLLK